MAIDPGLQGLLDELIAAKQTYARLLLDEESLVALAPPATPVQIARLERRVGKPLPPSYRQFLELHNGCDNFDGGAKLLSVEDQESEWVQQRLKAWAETADDPNENPFTHGALPVLLGETESNFLVLDPTTARQDGEMDFVMFDYMSEEERFENFTSFLRDQLKIVQGLIDGETKGTAK